jgi:hypothetical protein
VCLITKNDVSEPLLPIRGVTANAALFVYVVVVRLRGSVKRYAGDTFMKFAISLSSLYFSRVMLRDSVIAEP